MKALVVGLDGATFSVLEPLMRSGHMPNLEQALRRGGTGSLWSTVPPVTVLAWPSFVTGKNPGKHGLLSWQEPLNADSKRPLVNSSQMSGTKLWHLAGQAGLRVCVYNVPTTYPPEPVNGTMVTGMLTPGLEVEFTYPPSLKGDLLAAVPDYQIDVDVRISRPDTSNLWAVREFLKKAEAITRSRGKALRWLVERDQPDIVVAVLELPDRLQHLFWHYIAGLPESLDDTEQSKVIQMGLLSCYQSLDQEIGSLVRDLPTDAYLVFLSDHGFGPMDKSVHLDDWLAQHGWLVYDIQSRRRWEVLRRVGSTVKGWLPGRWLERARKALPLSRTFDWERTRAYAGTSSECGIFLNVKGREPAGTVAMEDYESLRTEIVGALGEWCDPETGMPIVTHTYRREELYTGPYVDRAPDIVVAFQRGYWPSDLTGRTGVLTDLASESWGAHEREGIFAMSGPGIGAEQRWQPAHIQDVMPTLLYALGLPVPDDLDGRVLDLFDPVWQTLHPVQYQSAGVQDAPERQMFTQDEEAAVANRLRGLGYME